jgi:hypothetical protein
MSHDLMSAFGGKDINKWHTPALWVLRKEENMNDRTKADKAWEARQEAARYRIFNAATNAAEASDEARMRTILQSWTKRATLPKLLPLRSPDTRLTPTC